MWLDIKIFVAQLNTDNRENIIVGKYIQMPPSRRKQPRRKQQPGRERKTTKRSHRKIGGKDGTGTSTIKVLSWNILARNATYHNLSTRDQTTFTEWVKTDDKPADITFNKDPENKDGKSYSTRDLHKGRQYEHIVDTARRFEKIKDALLAEEADVIFLQEIDEYLYKYLLKGQTTFDGYYRLPPLQKETFDLHSEFGTAILWNNAKFSKVHAVPLDYLRFGLFNTHNKKNDEPFDINSINYPAILGTNTEETLHKNEDDGTDFIVNPIIFTDPNKLTFTYETGDIISKHVNQISKQLPKDNMFGLKTATYVRLRQSTEPSDDVYDFVSVHLSGTDKAETDTSAIDNTNSKQTKMAKFIKDVLEKTKIPTPPKLTVIGGDFNCMGDATDNTPDKTHHPCFTNISEQLKGYAHVELDPNNTQLTTTTDSYDYIPNGLKAQNTKSAWIDHMWYTGGTSVPQLTIHNDVVLNVESAPIYPSKIVRLVSDHRAISATFSV